MGDGADADRALDSTPRFRPVGCTLDEARLRALPGLTIHDVVLLPIAACARLFESIHLPAPMDDATALLLDEIRARLRYLVEVGLGYLTLDRQSRSLSGGEVQRINLTTALGTSLVNALFVLDEPSIGLHARDMSRVVGVLHRLRDAGNTLLVVEHDAQVMLAADRVLDIGPGPGERGGEVVFFGSPDRAPRGRHLAHRAVPARREAGRRALGAPPPAPERRLPGGVRGGGAQPQGHRRPHSARPSRLRHRRERLGQVDPGGGHLLPGPAQALRQGVGPGGPAPGDPRPRTGRGRGDDRPVPDREDRALQPRELRRRAGRDPQGIRAGPARGRARLHPGHVQLQLGPGALPGLRRQRVRAHRDAVPQRRLPALRGLRRPALPPGGARKSRCCRPRPAAEDPGGPAPSPTCST